MSARACGAQRASENRGNRSTRLAGSLQPGAFPVVVSDDDDVDQVAALDRVVHEMGVAPEPQMDQRLAEFRRDVFRRHERAPGGAAGKARRLA